MKTFREIWSTIPGTGWLNRSEGLLLWNTAYKSPGPILEVGCYQGKSTVLLASLGRTVYSVDPLDDFDSGLSGDEIEARLLDNLVSRKIDNVVFYRLSIKDWAAKFLSTGAPVVGFAYLDGDHTYEGTVEQIRIAILAGAKNLCIHDYEDKGDGLEVKRAVRDEKLHIVNRVERMVHCRSGIV